jgi:hypothetical protein
MNRKKISQARKNGSSIIISLSGFANEQDLYAIEKLNNQIILTPIEVIEKK